MGIAELGSSCFGLVIGWVCYRTLRRNTGATGLSDISTVIGAVGGGAVTALFRQGDQFSWYAFGLALGFFSYFVAGLFVSGKKEVQTWMGDERDWQAPQNRQPGRGSDLM